MLLGEVLIGLFVFCGTLPEDLEGGTTATAGWM